MIPMFFNYVDEAEVYKDSNLWMGIGWDSNNSRRYLDITNIGKSIDSIIIRAIPGIYAFSGIDYIPAFYKKGKTKPFQLTRKNPRYIDIFASLGETPITK